MTPSPQKPTASAASRFFAYFGREEPSTAVHEALSEKKSLGYTTVLKLLQIMTTKTRCAENLEHSVPTSMKHAFLPSRPSARLQVTCCSAAVSASQLMPWQAARLRPERSNGVTPYARRMTKRDPAMTSRGISPSTMQALGWGLLHFVWQGTALAAVAGGDSLASDPNTRYVIGVATLVLMLAAPIGGHVLHATACDSSDRRDPFRLRAAGRPKTMRRQSIFPVRHRRSAPHVLLARRSMADRRGLLQPSLPQGGFVLLERERCRQSSVVEDRILEPCYMLQDRALGTTRAIQAPRVRVVGAPAVIGWLLIVFLPMSAAIFG